MDRTHTKLLSPLRSCQQWLKPAEAANLARLAPLNGAGRLQLCELERRVSFSATPIGVETLVNSTTAGVQETPMESAQAVAADANGNFVVTWTSDDASGKGVFAQRFNAAGVAQGSEFQVNSETSQDQQYASVAMDQAGNFVVTWTSTDKTDQATESMPSDTTLQAMLRGANSSSTPTPPMINSNHRSQLTAAATSWWPGPALDRMAMVGAFMPKLSMCVGCACRKANFE